MSFMEEIVRQVWAKERDTNSVIEEGVQQVWFEVESVSRRLYNWIGKNKNKIEIVKKWNRRHESHDTYS